VTRVVSAASGSAIDRVAVRDHGPPDGPSPETTSGPNATLGA
jgi:hypothetical protein